MNSIDDGKKDAKDEKIKIPFRHENSTVEFFVTNEENKINQYNNDVSKLDINHRDVEFNNNVIHHVYDWANLNNINANPVENWKKIIHNSDAYPIKDEGTLFEEITNTIDLLKQVTEICDEGERIANNDYEKKYYVELKATAMEAIKLLSKEPIV